MSKILRFVAVPLALSLGVISMIDSNTRPAAAGSSGPDLVRCEIRVKNHGSTLTLEGVALAKASVSGSYSMQISSSGGGGSSDIDQSGDFSASPGAPGSLGVVNLSGSGARYVARLHVTWNGGSAQCTKSVSAL